MSPIHRAKRLFDVAFIVCTAPATILFAVLASVVIKSEQVLRGRWFDPVLYCETRISAGKPFSFYKFNIFRGEVVDEMHTRGAFVHTKDLERNGGITHTGWCLKQVYMDELPQLLCVLRGDMSIVGPRPVNTEVFQRFMDEGIDVKARLVAGLTGPFQSLKDDHTASAHTLDRWYIEYVETHPWYAIIWNDLRIIIRTLRVVLRAKGL